MTPVRHTGLVWFRRDLRAEDNAALARALRECGKVHCVFVFDDDILAATARSAHLRVEFLWRGVAALQSDLRERGGGLHVLRGRADQEIPALAARLAASAVYFNHDYDPAAQLRDDGVRRALQQSGVAMHGCKDITVFEKSEVLTQSGGPFAVFTPYRNAWRKRLTAADYAEQDCRAHGDRLAADGTECPTFESLGFGAPALDAVGVKTGSAGAAALLRDFEGRMQDYQTARDFPAVKGVSYLSAHNRFGTVSVRELVRRAMACGGPGADTWLSELVWREFYFMILWHHPHVVRGAFKPRYDAIVWRNDESQFAAWCEGRTGYPIVDAAMRQLNQTGWMHNRLRMIVASFLTKDLHIDWRWGERYFADRLIDHDLAANNGGWQWAASTGCDAQPWFRIFNPVTQGERFDPKGRFVRRYVPELAALPDRALQAPWRLSELEQRQIGVILGKHYPSPVVDHARQREQALRIYEEARAET